MSEDNPKNAQDGAARVADSIDAAEGMTGFSVSFLKKLKDMGCPGFRGSRVYCDDVERYVEENNLGKMEETLAESDRLEIDIKRERHRKIKFQNDCDEGRYISKELISPRILDLGLTVKRALRTALEDELPLRIEGKSATDIRPIMREFVDKLCATFAQDTRDLTK